MLTADPATLAARTMNRLAAIAECSEDGPGVTRLPFTEQHRAANEMLAVWMRKAELAVRMDAAGTLIGRREGPAGAPTLLIGSHQDSIRNGGRYDGILGVVLPLTVLAAMNDHDLPFAVELLAFADEEGVRFPTALMGPRALAGTFDQGALGLADRDGISLGEALRAFGGDPDAIPGLKRSPRELLGYLELHIEQGPVLEAEDLGIGIVTGICGIERWRVTVTGKASHAGTTPMELRKDALTAAAEIALAVERRCRDTDGLVGVVGSLSVSPNVVNAVPGEVAMSVEFRAADDRIRAGAARELDGVIREIADRRAVGIGIDRTYSQDGVACDAGLQDLLAESIEDCGLRPLRLMSGATHDASAMADLCPAAMLFLRCRDGLSHHPDEAITEADAAIACEVLAHFLARLGSPVRGHETSGAARSTRQNDPDQ